MFGLAEQHYDVKIYSFLEGQLTRLSSFKKLQKF